MQMKRHARVLVTAVMLAAPGLCLGVGRFDCTYVGGTVPDLARETEGLTHTSDDKVFEFQHKGGKLTIPYAQITSLEYGETIGKHGVASAIGATAVAGSAGLLVFGITTRHRHYLTIGYLDNDQKPQTAVFEIGKDRIWATLKNLQKWSGKKLEYQDEKSRKEVVNMAP